MAAPREEVDKVRQIRRAGDGLRPTMTDEQKAEAEKRAAEQRAVASRIQGECAAFKSGSPTTWGILQNFHRIVQPPGNYTGAEGAIWREGVRAMQDYLADQAALWDQQ